MSEFVGMGFGDPHIVTLGGLTYTFNGLGEFWLLRFTRSAQLRSAYGIQSRTQRGFNQIKPDEPSSATVFTGFAIRSAWDYIYEVSREPLIA